MTVLEVIQKSADFLAKKGIESPRLHSELLLAHILKMPRLRLYLEFTRALGEAELQNMREFVRRRSSREPLQHITGSACFCGIEFKVNSHVLVPRPETELLAEAGWQFLGARIGNPTQPDNSLRESSPASAAPTLRFLDFGTGSGCIAVSIARNIPTASGVAVDASENALTVARENATASGVADRLQFAQINALSEANRFGVFDLIVSNPPYIPTGEIVTLQEEVRSFDPHLALDGGEDGLDFYRMLAREAKALLNPNGKIMLEFGDGQESALPEIFSAQNWVVEKILPDYTARPRILIAHAG